MPDAPPSYVPRHKRNGNTTGRVHHATGTTRSSTALGYGYAWERLRLFVLQDEHYICRKCGQFGNQCDHIVPKRLGGTDDRSNLQCLCIRCHSIKTTGEQRAAKKSNKKGTQ